MGAVDQVQTWVNRVVVGLDLCPFARAPLTAGRARFVECRGQGPDELLAELLIEAQDLGDQADTTLLVMPSLDHSFDDFLDLVGMAEALLDAAGMAGAVQLAHFHPQYVFAGVDADDPANHTNRAPHAVLHLLRWTDVREAMETHPSVQSIPKRNQALLRGIGQEGLPDLSGPAQRDLRHALAPFKCWDQHTQAIFDAHNEALEDCILQNREEVIGLAEFIETHEVKSYLEIGIWTGRLVSALHTVFDFDRVAAADQGYAKTRGMPIHLPKDAEVFWGDSDSQAFLDWRASLGHIDLVFIDANHSEKAVRRDFEINREFPHRFLAFHDIMGTNRWTVGVKRFWESLTEGHKQEICRPHAELGLETSTMGIGVWSEVLP